MSERSIIRVQKDRDNPYVMISRDVFENAGLSWQAKGLLGYLLSRPDDWRVMVRDLVNRSTNGRDACYGLLRELGTAGYVARVTTYENNLANGVEYVVFERPDASASASWESGYRDSVSRESVSRKPDTTNKEGTKKESTKKETQRKGAEKYDPETDGNLPEWLDRGAWADFATYRAGHKKHGPLTPLAATKLLSELGRLRDQGHDPERVLDRSILHGWASVYELPTESARGSARRAVPAAASRSFRGKYS